MAETQFAGLKRFRLTALLAGLFALCAIAFLGISVAREVSQLDRSEQGNAQWSLSQTEIEFLEFANAISGPETDLSNLRLRYDIFYSRIVTLRDASAFAQLRQEAVFMAELDAIKDFLDATVDIIDGPDAILRDRLPEVLTLAQSARPHTRLLAIAGLQRFTEVADAQRRAVALTTAELAAAIVALFAGLALALFNLDRTNKRAAARGRELQQSAARMNTIIETALDGVIVTDAQFKIVEFSPAAQEIFKLDASDAVGQELFRFVNLLSTEDDETHQKLTISQILGQRSRIKRHAKRADGATFPAELAFERANTPDGDIYITFVRDISLRVAAEEELVTARDTALENEQVKTDFLATMSHEIRTPLNGLLGNLDLLRDTVLSQPQQRYIHNMEISGRMLMRHVSDVLDITQFDTGRMKITSQNMHLPSLLNDIVATQSGLATAQNTTLEWNWQGPKAEWVKADVDRIQHILMNLIGNAVKFTSGGKVTVLVSHYKNERQPHLRFEIADTGTGISPDLIPRIFDDFVTGDSAYDRQVDGTGLGLGIAKRFATGMGGTVHVQSELGRGSTFILDLPVEITAAPERPAMLKTLPPLPTHRILVVEDNSINRTVVREMLEADGHLVTEATNGQEGVAKADQTAFDLVLMDISMPVMDGQAAAREIKGGTGQSKNTPIVALTANALAEEKANFLAASMITTITKPVTRAALRTVLRELSAPITAPSTALVNTAHLAETRDTLGSPAFEAILHRYAEEAQAFLDWFQTCPPAPFSEIADRAHKLAGSTALFGATRFRTALEDLETTARADNNIRTIKFRPVLETIWQDTQAALSESEAAAAKSEAS